MPQSISEQILDFLRRPEYRPLKPRRLARAMRIDDSRYREFRSALRDLSQRGQIALGGGGALALPASSGSVVGLFQAHRRGFGFVIPETPTSHGDLFIPPGAEADAQDGDTVLCRVRAAGRRHGRPVYSGQVVRIVRRGSTTAVGRLHHLGGRWLVQPDGDALRQPIQVGDISAKGARSGDQVVVEILEFPTALMPARGVIVECLGAHGQPGIDVLSIIRRHGLPDHFSAVALAEARSAAAAVSIEDELHRRLDLREELLITIDPPDARDFDDAISLRRLDQPATLPPENADGPPIIRRRRRSESRGRAGRSAAGAATDADQTAGAVWELGVHIADVSRFVAAGTALDAEARERGTSVYFPRHVVPMLPEILSNGVCSLQEGQPRLCKSVFIQLDADGRPVATRFANSVVRSSCRLTYEQAQAAIDGAAGEIPHAVVTLLRELDELARVIRQRRLRQGMLVLDLPEIDLVLDDSDRVIDARPTDASFTHTIIEMFMVEANEAVARELTRRGVTFLRRVHPEPEARSLESLVRFLRTVGVSLSRRPSRSDLQRVLSDIRGQSSAGVVNLAVLKAMAQAIYAPGDEGHYALASDCYCHFTSPIRRYPDLHIHRLLEACVLAPQADGKPRKAPSRSRRPAARRIPHDEPTLFDIDSDEPPADRPDASVAALGRHCSLTERRAQEAERELRLVKVLEFLGRHVGESFDGVVTAMTKSGLFVQHPRFLVDGIVDMADLPDDRWELNETRSALEGRRSGRRFRLGDTIRVQIAQVDVPRRLLTLALSARSGSAGPGKRRRSRKR